MGAILSPGKRTVSSALNILGIGQHGDFAVYHHVLNRARWSPLQLSRVLLLLVAGRLGSSTEPLVFGIDETVERRWGRKIAAKGRYRDPVRSKDDQVVMTPGLQWVSLMLLTRIGWAGRHWALPFLTALVVSARYDRRKGRRHKTFTDSTPSRCWSACAGGCRRGTWWWWPMAATPSASSCGIARVCQSRLSSSPNCARTRPCLDFAHFKRHDRGDLQVDDAERPGVPEYLGQLRTVKNLPTPATDVAAPERWQPLLFSDFVQSPAKEEHPKDAIT